MEKMRQVMVAVAVAMALAGCQSTGTREGGTSGVMTIGTTDDNPMLALSHKATLDYWKARNRAMKEALRAATAHKDIFREEVRYAEGVSSLHAGMGGLVEGIRHSSAEVAEAVRALPKGARTRLTQQMADLNDIAAESILHKPKARKKLESFAFWWQVLAED